MINLFGVMIFIHFFNFYLVIGDTGDVLALKSLLLIDPSGVPIATYPEDLENDSEMSIFSGIVLSLVKFGRSSKFGEVREIRIGDDVYLVKVINDSVLLAIFDSNGDENYWLLDALNNALSSMLRYVRDEEGVVKNYEISVFKNIFKKFYEKYDNIMAKISKISEIYNALKDKDGEKILQMIGDIVFPEMDVYEKDNKIYFKDVKIGDIDRINDLFDKALSYLLEKKEH